MPRTHRSCLPVLVTGGVLPARAISATFSSDSGSHRTKTIPWIRDLETSSRSFNHPLEPGRCAAKWPAQRNLRGICILLRTRPNRLPYRHICPLSRATVCTAVAGCSPAACSQWLCYDQHQQPTAMRNQSYHCAYLTVALGPWLASYPSLHRTTVCQYQASHFTISPGVAVDRALS